MNLDVVKMGDFLANVANLNKSINAKSNVTHSKVSNHVKEKFVAQKIINMSSPDFKKATPCLKLPSILSPDIKKNVEMSEEIKQKFKKYCRVCAGMKVPMIDFFSAKGNQMRLLQQIQHLEDINKDTSLSTQICMECICEIRASYKLFMQIKKAEMKLQSIYDSLNKVSKETDIHVKSEVESDTSDSPRKLENIESNISYDSQSFKMEMFEETDYEEHYDEVDDTFNEGDEAIFEEFDPIDISDEQKFNEPSSSNEISYKFDDLVNSYTKIDTEEKNQFLVVPKTKETDNTIKVEDFSSPPNHSPKRPNILKRKAITEHMNDGDPNKCKNIDTTKLNMDLRVKIPRLNLDKPINVDSKKGDIIYVTAKGNKPNEMLLIKVKKIEKNEKSVKPTSNVGKPSKNDIDEQIELYKKRKAAIMGDVSNLSDSVIENTEVRKGKYFSDDEDIPSNMKNYFTQKRHEDSMPTLSDSSQDIKLKLKYPDIGKKAYDKDVSEECINRLKSILGQKDEYISDFISHLRQRKIIISRLKDEDVIALYEAKNNVVIQKPHIPEEEPEEDNTDPFEPQESFDCDFCFESFKSLELEFAHEKNHEVKLMHYCFDCETEFISYKAKRAHNATCIHKVLCRFCEMVLDTKGKKRQHEQKHCDDEYGQLCDRCGEKFKHQGTLDQHLKIKHMKLEKVFKCPQCPKKFAFRTKLTFHLKTVHTTSRAYLCEDCGSNFKNPASLRHHRVRKHQISNNTKECKECHKMILVYSMSKHMSTHKSYSIQCEHCDKKFKNTSTLKQHMRIHEDQRQYKCDHCGVGFNRRDGLRLHLRVHEKGENSKGIKECSCQVCGRKFPNHSTLVIHRNRDHRDGRNYTCNICNRSMVSIRSLEWHMTHIHNESYPITDSSGIDAETKRIMCKHCDKTFKTEMILRNHVKNTHIEKEPMNCLDCNLTFTSEVRLKHHMMITHNRMEGTLGCPHCTKRFVNHLRLKTHMISHSEERPFTCDDCGFMLKTKIQLVKHKQNRHSNERPLQCKYCPHTCKQVSALVCHERTHTNERPYACSVCQQKFKYLGDRNKHERRHESLGGSGFKRIITSRDSTGGTSRKRNRKKKNPLLVEFAEQGDHFEVVSEEYIDENGVVSIESFDPSSENAKLDGESTASNSRVSFEQVYVDNLALTASNDEVATRDEDVENQMETQMMSQLPPVTVIQIEEQDEAGNVTIVPYTLVDNLSSRTSDMQVNVPSTLMLQRLTNTSLRKS
ncbi:uncharacterized protein LOC106647318 [Copidosoma floridanum]|uniref:uncharacterized protein LOC106647318 n=1 Tax=Copidosoma floridanum TaxID=29053 RepID=UPI0006C93DC8|nr:uncharacterized protein LOC106647318 [Copidosoma floridanum]